MKKLKFRIETVFKETIETEISSDTFKVQVAEETH